MWTKGGGRTGGNLDVRTSLLYTCGHSIWPIDLKGKAMELNFGGEMGNHVPQDLTMYILKNVLSFFVIKYLFFKEFLDVI